jgi:hypothetical protein
MTKGFLELRKASNGRISETERLKEIKPGDLIRFKIIGMQPSIIFTLMVKGTSLIEADETDDEEILVGLDGDGFSFGAANTSFDVISMTNDCTIEARGKYKSCICGTFVAVNDQDENIMFETEFEITWEKI